MKAFIPFHIVGEITLNPTQGVTEPTGTQRIAFGVRKPDTDEDKLVHTDGDAQANWVLQKGVLSQMINIIKKVEDYDGL